MELSQIIALVAGLLVFTVLATYLAVAVPGLRMASHGFAWLRWSSSKVSAMIVNIHIQFINSKQ